MFMPEAPWIRGSTITAAVGCCSSSRSSAAKAAASRASTPVSPSQVAGQGARATSNKRSS